MSILRSGLLATLALVALVAAAPAAPSAVGVTAASAVTAEDVVGWWLTEDGKAAVDITTCQDGLCGRIAWLQEPVLDGASKVDANNPSRNLRQRELAGLLVLNGFDATPDKKGRFTGGEIYDPRNGKTYYRCTLTIDDKGRVKLSGYGDIVRRGRTTVRARSSRTVEWTRASQEALASR